MCTSCFRIECSFQIWRVQGDPRWSCMSLAPSKMQKKTEFVSTKPFSKDNFWKDNSKGIQTVSQIRCKFQQLKFLLLFPMLKISCYCCKFELLKFAPNLRRRLNPLINFRLKNKPPAYVYPTTTTHHIRKLILKRKFFDRIRGKLLLLLLPRCFLLSVACVSNAVNYAGG